jgi:hypothetical protein
MRYINDPINVQVPDLEGTKEQTFLCDVICILLAME